MGVVTCICVFTEVFIISEAHDIVSAVLMYVLVARARARAPAPARARNTCEGSANISYRTPRSN